jgi:hypothetical protein
VKANDRVAIVGHGIIKYADEVLVPGPFADPGYDVWGMNALYSDYPTEGDMDGGDYEAFMFHAWFQLHTPRYMEKHWARGWAHHQLWLERKHPFPIYMQKRYRRFPSSMRFPKEQVEDLTPFGWYHASTFDWMFAFAIAEGYQRIELWGVNLGPGEPLSGRACMEYWMGVAHGKGIELYVEQPTDLISIEHVAKMQSQLQYAYDEEPALELGHGWKDVR